MFFGQHVDAQVHQAWDENPVAFLGQIVILIQQVKKFLKRLGISQFFMLIFDEFEGLEIPHEHEGQGWGLLVRFQQFGEGLKDFGVLYIELR